MHYYLYFWMEKCLNPRLPDKNHKEIYKENTKTVQDGLLWGLEAAGLRTRSIKQGKKPLGFLGLSVLVTFVNSRWLKRRVSLLLQDSISTHKKGIRNLPASPSVDLPLDFLYLVTTQTVYECHKQQPFNSTDWLPYIHPNVLKSTSDTEVLLWNSEHLLQLMYANIEVIHR